MARETLIRGSNYPALKSGSLNAQVQNALLGVSILATFVCQMPGVFKMLDLGQFARSVRAPNMRSFWTKWVILVSSNMVFAIHCCKEID